MERILTLSLLTLFVAIGTLPHADARPKYLKGFIDTYPQVKTAKDVKCSVCHGMKNKKSNNDYGTALKDELDAENVKADALIVQALKAIEDKPSAVPGKTFGDLLEDGELPGELID